METDETLFRRYLLNYYTQHNFKDSTVCDANCRRAVLCNAASSDGYLVRSVRSCGLCWRADCGSTVYEQRHLLPRQHFARYDNLLNIFVRGTCSIKRCGKPLTQPRDRSAGSQAL